MHPKYLFTVAVLLFIVAGVVMLANRESSHSDASADIAAREALDRGPRRVVLFCFHTRQRCFDCVALEEGAREALAEGFAAEMEAGRLQWQTVDRTRPENAHFATRYQLTHNGLIVDEVGAGERHQEPRVLTEAWDFTHDKDRLKEYVQENVRAMLDRLDG